MPPEELKKIESATKWNKYKVGTGIGLIMTGIMLCFQFGHYSSVILAYFVEQHNEIQLLKSQAADAKSEFMYIHKAQEDIGIRSNNIENRVSIAETNIKNNTEAIKGCSDLIWDIRRRQKYQ